MCFLRTLNGFPSRVTQDLEQAYAYVWRRWHSYHLQDHVMPPYLDFLDTSNLPAGFSDQAYATWQQAVRDLQNSQTLMQVEHSFQFCLGFVKALQDTQAVAPEVYLFLETQVREIWLERVSVLQSRSY